MFDTDVIIETVFKRFNLPKVDNTYCRDHDNVKAQGILQGGLQGHAAPTKMPRWRLLHHTCELKA